MKGNTAATVLAIAAALVFFVVAAVKTHAFGTMSIVGAPFYPQLVQRIASDGGFQRALGTPIRVDDAAVFCSRINLAGLYGREWCELPVSGAFGSGSVDVYIFSYDETLNARLTLRVGTQKIDGADVRTMR